MRGWECTHHDSNQLICVLLRPARQCCVDINGIVVYNPNIYLFQFIDERAISVKGHNKLSSRDINWCVICLWPTAVTCINTFPERQSRKIVWSPWKHSLSRSWWTHNHIHHIWMWNHSSDVWQHFNNEFQKLDFSGVLLQSQTRSESIYWMRALSKHRRNSPWTKTRTQRCSLPTM